MIRPSALNRAELCGLASKLAEKFPESGDAADKGKAIHKDIVEAWMMNRPTLTPEAAAALGWLTEQFDPEQRKWFEEHQSLVDTDSMEVITEGTPDLVIDTAAGAVVVDWKTGRPENVPEPDENLQLIAYGLAVCDGRPFQTCLVFLDKGDAAAKFSRWFESSEHPALLARVKAAATREASASPGEHCGSCWQRVHCYAWQARAKVALQTIPGDRQLALTDETAAQVIQRVKEVREAADMAEALVKAHVANGGRCIVDGKEWTKSTSKGRESADVKALKADGLDKYIKAGAPFESWRWKKAEKGTTT